MEKSEIDQVLAKARKFLNDNRDDKNPPMLKGKFQVTESGIVIPMDDEAARELGKTGSSLKHTPWWGFKGGR